MSRCGENFLNATAGQRSADRYDILAVHYSDLSNRGCTKFDKLEIAFEELHAICVPQCFAGDPKKLGIIRGT
jgi:hypothetical protein